MVRARDDREVETTMLANGLKVAYCNVPGSVECCGVGVMAGSRDERTDEYGLAHFVEHTIFKGTKKRRSHHVINRMESVGGELNAYTTKEETFVYTLAPAGNVGRSIELIGDLVCNCTFPTAQLEKERDVVIDEINSYLDTPDAAVYDDFEDLIFEGSSLGHNILGTKKIVRRLGTEDCRRWVDEHYKADRMALSYAGPAPMSRIVKLAESYLGILSPNDKPLVRDRVCAAERFDIVKSIHSHQAHTVIGSVISHGTQRERDAMALCNNILGGPGMNSRFNVALREKRGLVYTVESAITRYTDCGLWNVYYGGDPSNTAQCRGLILDEIKRLVEEPPSTRALNRAKCQFVGQAALGRASVESRAMGIGRAVLRGEESRTLVRIKGDYDNLTPDDVRESARKLLSDLSILTMN